MNILVVCHNYKEHQLLTLVLGNSENEYIYLTPDNIPKISELTNGVVNKISFIDTDKISYKETDEYQYNNWDRVPNDFYDYFFTMYCPPGINFDAYKSKLKMNGKRIDIGSFSPKQRPDVVYEYSEIFPFILSPLYPYTERRDPRVYYMIIYDDFTGNKELKFFDFNRPLIPTMDDWGVITIPTRRGGRNRRNRRKTKKAGKKNGTKKGGRKYK